MKIFDLLVKTNRRPSYRLDYHLLVAFKGSICWIDKFHYESYHPYDRKQESKVERKFRTFTF